MEHQTAPETTKGLFGEPGQQRQSMPMPEPSRSRQQPRRNQPNRSRVRSASTSAMGSPVDSAFRQNHFQLQTLNEEDGRRRESVTVDSLQSMINTLKSLPPVDSKRVGTGPGHRRQSSQSTPFHKRLSYQSATNSNRRNSMYEEDEEEGRVDDLSRDAALAEAQAKLMGTYRPASFHDNTPPDNTLNPGRRRRASTLSHAHRTSLPTVSEKENVSRLGLFGKRASEHHKSWMSRTASQDGISDSGYGHENAGGYGYPSDPHWRRSFTGEVPLAISTTLQQHGRAFHIVPFSPTRVQFSRDDTNRQNRRPLFSAHLPFSSLPPLFNTKQLVRGTLRVNRRNRSDAFVFCEELNADIYVCGSRDRNRAMEGDVVAILLVDVERVLREKKEKEDAKAARNGGNVKVRMPDEEDENEIIFGGDEQVEVCKPKCCGIVVAIMEREQNQLFPGTLVLKRPNHKREQEGGGSQDKDALPRIVWFKAADKRVPLMAIPVEQVPSDFVQKSDHYASTLFVASMKRWPITSLHPFGTLERELGSVYDLDTQTKAVLAENNVSDAAFSPEVQECLPPLPYTFSKDDNDVSSRRDLRGLRVFTIDPSGSQVFDDALSIQRLSKDRYEVGIHISDVSHFIKAHSPLDKEARARGVRVDLVHTVVPMLPTELTEQVTNLIANETRLAFSVICKLSAEGHVFDTWFGKTIVQSSAQLDYEKAQQYLQDEKDDCLGQDIRLLDSLAAVLRQSRAEQGILTQKRTELGYALANADQPVQECTIADHPMAKMVQEFLLLANKSVAQKISQQFPEQAMLRRQAPPDKHRMHELQAFASRHLGVELNVSSAGALEKSIEGVADPILRKLVSALVLKIVHAPKYFCTGTHDILKYEHYALNLPLFTHFTAPSSRFVDLIVHRQLEAALAGEHRFSLECAMVQRLAQHCNVKKEAALNARVQSNLLFQARYLSDTATSSAEAVVVAVFESYFDVMVPELNLEKRIHLAHLPVWRNHFDIGARTLTLYWRKGVDTTTGEQHQWSLSDDEDYDLDDDTWVSDMKDPMEQVKDTAVGEVPKTMLDTAQQPPAKPEQPVPTATQSKSNRRASVLRARLSESTAFSAEEGYQTIKALDKVRVVILIEKAKTPPVIRVLASNPFA